MKRKCLSMLAEREGEMREGKEKKKKRNSLTKVGSFEIAALDHRFPPPSLSLASTSPSYIHRHRIRPMSSLRLCLFSLELELHFLPRLHGLCTQAHFGGISRPLILLILGIE